MHAMRRERRAVLGRRAAITLAVSHLHVAPLNVVEREVVWVWRAWGRVGETHSSGLELSLPLAPDATAPDDEADDDEHEREAADEDVWPPAKDHLLVPNHEMMSSS